MSNRMNIGIIKGRHPRLQRDIVQAEDMIFKIAANIFMAESLLEKPNTNDLLRAVLKKNIKQQKNLLARVSEDLSFLRQA